MKCNHCKDDLENIHFSYTINGVVEIWLSHFKERATLWVCTSRDCKNRGTVIAIPCNPKSE